MKKYFLLVITVLLVLNSDVAAQKKPAPKKPATGAKPAAGTLTKADAGKIIDMTNCVVDIYNEQISEIKDIADCINYFEKSIDAVAENPKTTIHSAGCNNIRNMRNDYLEKLDKNAKLAPAFSEKAGILEGIEVLKKEFDLGKERCLKVQEYFSKKEYQTDDDEFSKYVALRDSFVNSYRKIKREFNRTMDLASAAGDRAEVVILKSSPIASVVVPMKTNLSAVSQLMAKCRDDEPNAAAITAEIAAIRKALEKDKVATPTIKTALKKIHNGDDRFERFYKYEAEALVEAEKYVEFLNPEKKIDDVDHILKETEEQARERHLNKYYIRIQDQYRYMIDIYNNI